MHIPDPIAKAAKAILAGSIAGLGALAVAMVCDPDVAGCVPGFAAVNSAEWVAVSSTTLTAVGVVYGVRNRAA